MGAHTAKSQHLLSKACVCLCHENFVLTDEAFLNVKNTVFFANQAKNALFRENLLTFRAHGAIILLKQATAQHVSHVLRGKVRFIP